MIGKWLKERVLNVAKSDFQVKKTRYGDYRRFPVGDAGY